MKRKKLYGLAVIVGVLCASTAQASLTVILRNTSNRATSGPGVGGGEFIAQVTGQNFTQYYYDGAGQNDPVYTGLAGGVGFATFCLEHGEFVNFNSSYTVALNNGAVSGGPGAVAGKDIISKGTAWLYSQFAKGTLAGYNYTDNTAARRTSAGFLQDAFWYLEQEISLTAVQIAANPFLTLLTSVTGANFGSLALAAANSTGDYGVLVMNLYSANGSKIQDQLVIVPEASTIMAAALLLLPFGASTIRILRKNRTV